MTTCLQCTGKNPIWRGVIAEAVICTTAGLAIAPPVTELTSMAEEVRLSVSIVRLTSASISYEAAAKIGVALAVQVQDTVVFVWVVVNEALPPDLS